MGTNSEGEAGGVTVTVESPPTDDAPMITPDAINAELAEAAAEATVVAAQTAVVMAEAQSAAVMADAAETVAEVTEKQRTIEEEIEWLKEQINLMQATLANLSTPPPSPEVTVIAEEAEVEVETADPAMTSLSTPSDTSAPTDETQMEVSVESGSEESAPPERRPRRRWI